MPTRRDTLLGEDKAHSKSSQMETLMSTWSTIPWPLKVTTRNNSVSKIMDQRIRKTEWKISKWTRTRAQAAMLIQVAPRDQPQSRMQIKLRFWWTNSNNCWWNSNNNNNREVEATLHNSKSQLFNKRRAPSQLWLSQTLQELGQAQGIAARSPTRTSLASLEPRAAEVTRTPPHHLDHRVAAASPNTLISPSLSESTCRITTKVWCQTLALRRHNSIKRAREQLVQLRTHRTPTYLRS